MNYKSTFPDVRIFPTPSAVAEAVAEELMEALKSAAAKNRPLHIALSGGSTPKLLFDVLAERTGGDAHIWDFARLYWGDERCVPPDDSDSNYRMTREHLFDQVNIVPENIFRVLGEADPQEEALRYGQVLTEQLPKATNGFPRFDWIFLGMGGDGHTASLFPNTEPVKENKAVCVVAEHPDSGQKRVSLTLPVLNAAVRVTFLVTGASKTEKIDEIFNERDAYQQYPAAMVQPDDGRLEWMLDEAAGAPIGWK